MSSAFAQFTEYDNLKGTFTGLVSQQLPSMNQSQFEQTKAALTLYCRQPGRTTVNFADAMPGSYGSLNITMKCSDITTAASSQAFFDLVAIAMFDGIYYKNYTCSFVTCVTTLPNQDKIAVIASRHANSFFKQAVFICIGGMVVGLLLITVGIRRIFGIFKAVGIEMIIAGALSYVSINAVKGMVPAGVSSIAGPVVDSLVATISSNLIIVVIVGVILAVIGFVGARKFRKSEKNDKIKAVKKK